MTSPNATPAIALDSVVAATKEQVASDLAGEVILLSLQTAMYYGLDQVGARIWELLQQPKRVVDIRDAILSEYEVEPDRCERDVLELLGKLATEGLIEVRGATGLG